MILVGTEEWQTWWSLATAVVSSLRRDLLGLVVLQLWDDRESR